MGFSSHSKVVQPAKWVDPLNLDLVYKDTMYKEGIAQQNLNELQQISSQLGSIPAFGADSEHLSKKLNELKSSLGNLNLSNLTDFNTMAQLKGALSNFKNDSEILNIAQRGNFYRQELKKKEEDPNYISPGLDEAEEYYSSGQYIGNKTFSRTGWKSPEMQKLEAEYLKNVKEETKKVLIGGNWVETKGYDQDQLNRVYDELYSREDVLKTKKYQLEKAARSQGVSFSEIGRQMLMEDLSKAQYNLSLNPNNQQARNYVEQYQFLLNDNARLEQIGKDRYLDKIISEEKEQAKKAAQYKSTGTITADAFMKDAQITANNIREYEQKKILDNQYELGISPSDYSSPEQYREAVKQKSLEKNNNETKNLSKEERSMREKREDLRKRNFNLTDADLMQFPFKVSDKIVKLSPDKKSVIVDDRTGYTLEVSIYDFLSSTLGYDFAEEYKQAQEKTQKPLRDALNILRGNIPIIQTEL